jgi:heme/copper-type cytochrome/quinol oxidase subunit 2
MILKRMTAAVFLFGAACGLARAEDLQVISLTLKNHKFTPAEIHVPTGKAVQLVIANQDDTADEFEMRRPPIEKVIAPGGEGKVRLPPLAPGKFPFMGEFHADTAQGVIVSQ